MVTRSRAVGLMARVGIGLMALFLVHGPARGHDDEGPHSHENGKTVALPRGLVLPAMPGPRPWSDKPHLNDPNRFQIAIMTDRTGGHRPGIWEQGVRVVNLLRPEFVISVGDLIEGYSEDPKEIEGQWAEFLGFIDAMKMKFFFVAGNHDLSNPLMHKIWRQHFGAEWYSFDYKGVHFVALSSEDTEDQIGAEQFAWLEQDLAKNASARWTLLFLHKPLWLIAERELVAGNADPTNWKRVEKLLASRPHTVFAGHVHHYVQYDRNGQKYFHLATTGGGTLLRGVPYGEFDQVMWLTMEADGPHTAIILLDGVLAPDAVTEKGIARFREFLAKATLEVAPILLDDDFGFSSGRIDLRLTNTLDVPVKVQAQIAGLPLRGLTVDPAMIELEAPAGETESLALAISFSEKIDFARLARTTLTARLVAADEPSPLVAERSLPVLIDRGFDCPQAERAPEIDGELSDWQGARWHTEPMPQVFGPEGRWQGLEDGSVEFATLHDDRYVYIAARVTDERLLAGADGLEILFDPRPPSLRQGDGRLRAGAFQFHFDAPAGDAATEVRAGAFGRSVNLEGALGVARRDDMGYRAELAIPLRLVSPTGKPDWHSFQLSLAMADADQAGDEPNRILWRGTPDYSTRNTGFGHFRRR